MAGNTRRLCDFEDELSTTEIRDVPIQARVMDARRIIILRRGAADQLTGDYLASDSMCWYSQPDPG